MVEYQPSKLRVAGSKPVSRSILEVGPCGSVVEHTLGKGEAVGSIPAMGSITEDSIPAMGSINEGSIPAKFVFL